MAGQIIKIGGNIQAVYATVEENQDDDYIGIIKMDPDSSEPCEKKCPRCCNAMIADMWTDVQDDNCSWDFATDPTTPTCTVGAGSHCPIGIDTFHGIAKACLLVPYDWKCICTVKGTIAASTPGPYGSPMEASIEAAPVWGPPNSSAIISNIGTGSFPDCNTTLYQESDFTLFNSDVAEVNFMYCVTLEFKSNGAPTGWFKTITVSFEFDCEEIT